MLGFWDSFMVLTISTDQMGMMISTLEYGSYLWICIGKALRVALEISFQLVN